MTKRRKSRQQEATARGMRRVTVELPEKLCKQIDAEAKRQGLMFSHVMRLWLREKTEAA